MRLSLLAVALLVAAPVFAQSNAEPLRPGDVDVSAVEPYTASYRIFVKQGSGGAMPFGTMSETFSIEDGVATSTVSVNAPGQTQNDVIRFTWPAMEPISQRSDVNGSVEEISFDGLTATGTLRNGNALDATFDAPVFGSGVTDLIARTLAMEEGTTASFYAFDDEAEGHVSTTTITVGGTEEVLGRTAHVITSEDGEQTVTMWYDAEAGQMLQIGFAPQPGITVEIQRSDLAEEATE